MEVFARCPHSGMLFSSTWIIEAFVAPKHGHRHAIAKATIWKSSYRSSGGYSSPLSGLAFNTSAMMGQVVATKDCSKFVDMLDENAVTEVADRFYHKDPQDM